MEEEEKQKIFQELMQKYFMKCDRFLVEKWKENQTPFVGQIPDHIRQEAYHHFYRIAGKAGIASRPTIQRWFGIRGQAIPKREQIIHLAFVCGFSPEETKEYLQYAISEPDFQLNDYREIIALYGLENQMSYQEYENMVEYFEQYSDWNIPIRQTAHTDEIMRRYEPVKHLEPKEFLVWMRRNEELFKGYSMTTYQNFMSLVEEALNLFRMEIRDLLFLTLEDTGFFQWAREQHVPEAEYGKEIRHFIKNSTRHVENCLSKEKVAEIQMLTNIAYSPLRRVCDLLSEIYEGIHFSHTRLNDKRQKELKREIGTVNAKYISELISISTQKEREMRLLQAYTKCRRKKAEDICPEEIQKLLSEGKKKRRKQIQTVEAARTELEEQIRMQRQRTHDIRRADLLVLTHYVSQKRYLRQISDSKAYVEEEAKTQFINTSDAILNVCGMRPINGNYQLDYLLLQCFGSDDIYELADLME